MGLGRPKGDAPRVVGFDFGAPPPAPYVPEAPAEAAVPPPPPAPEPTYPAYPPPPAEPAYAGAPPPPPTFGAVPGYGVPPAPSYPAPPAPPPGYGAAPVSQPFPAAPYAPATPTPYGGGMPYDNAPPAQPPFQQYQPYVPPMAQPRPATPSAAKGIGREITAIVALFTLIVVVAGVQRLRGGDDEDAPAAAPAAPRASISLPPLLEDLNAPSSVGGEQRLNTRFGRALARSFRESLPNGGRFSEIEIYGFDNAKYLLVAGDLTKGNSAAMWSLIAKSQRNINWGTPRAQAGGLTCGSMRFGGINGSMCAWSTKVSDGVVVAYAQSNLARTAQVTAKAVKDVERGR